MKSLLILSLLAAPAAAQTVQYSTQLDQPQSAVSWSVSSSIGTVNVSPSNFNLGGSIELLTDSVNAPFTTGAINGATVFTSPNTLSGEIPNILPFLPPLATFDITGLQFDLTAPTFQVDPAGDFIAVVTLTTTAGINTLGGLFGSGSDPVTGIVSTPTPVTGNLSQSGTTITLFLDLNVQVVLDDPVSGISSTLDVTGPVVATVDTANANSMHLDRPLPLIAGAPNTVQVNNATPGGAVFLAGSLTGLGSIFIAPLGVTSGLAAPVQAGTATADALGNASFSLNVPAGFVGRAVWLQALEPGRTSNAAGTWVE